jgi:alkanesulfonate monooxygenase SsuD/methylene tetrahydromethanopterin reductase-like flavin-dependent oxidoreductase (luciferase family)
MDTISCVTFWNNYKDHLPDPEFMKKEMAVNKLMEPLGFDIIFSVEHHFSSYSMGPDHFQFLGHMAAITNRIKLGTLGVILPWNDPLRVAERVILLDHLSDGRAVYGMARGLAKREYVGFRQEMEESRGRFDESARMTCKAIEDGYIEGSGKYFPQPRTPLRPRPLKSFAGRKYMVAMSPDTVPICAEVGAVQCLFAFKPWPETLPTIEEHRSLYEKFHHEPAPPVLTADLCFCDDSSDRAYEAAHNYVAKYFDSFAEHYEIFGKHLTDSKSYANYSGAAAARDAIGLDAMVNAFVDSNVWGTPKQILEKYEERRSIIGDFQASVTFSYSGMTFDEAKGSMTSYATKVMPELRRWSPRDKRKAA